MKQNLFSDLTEQNNEYDRKIEHTPNTPADIEDYRRSKTVLLEQIMENAASAGPSESDIPFYKLGITIACQIVKTRVAETTSDGYIKTELSLIPEDMRSFCIHSYDQLLSFIRKYDRMYIPDLLERDLPDIQKRIAIFQQYDMQKQRAVQDARKKNTEINRLFGSRG